MSDVIRQGAYRQRSRGAVLVLTLACVTIITILLVAYISIVSRDRQATQNYAQALGAEQIGLGGLDQVVAQLQAEISDPNLSLANGSSPNLIYIPQANIDSVPQRTVPFSSNNPTLVKMSVYGVPFFTSSGSSAAGSFASPSLTTTLSLNGRGISVARWNSVRLALSTDNFPVPEWVLVTRAGPQVFTTYTSSLANPALNNASYVVGRYAYNIYDTSGLIDINVAGNPSNSTSKSSGILPFADLTQLANAVTQTGVTQPDVDNLVNWRNTANYSAYAAYATNWANNGFMQVAPGDNTFLSRQELINYAQTQNPDLVNVLPYLTTFSREFNGPTWEPSMTTANAGGAPYDYVTHQYSPTTATINNVFILNPKVAVPFTRNNGTAATPGEPLVKYRFPLDKLALLEKQGTVGLSVQDKSDILKYFGLVLSPDSNGLYRHWIYTNPAGGAASVAKILTLDQVAALTQGREPDFFELLQAGILQGSLGKTGRSDDLPGYGPYSGGAYAPPNTWTDPDSKITYQIMRIGANIIDQWDADDYPTRITYAGEDFYGIEDLPYINKLLFKAIGTGATLTCGVPGPPWTAYLYFELWNPHQPSGNGASTYPSAFRIAPVTGATQNDYYSLGVILDNTKVAPTGQIWYWTGLSGGYGGGSVRYFQNLPNAGAMPFTATSGDYREPTVIPGPTAPWPGGPNIAAWKLQTSADPTALNNFPTDGIPSSEGAYAWQTGASGTSSYLIPDCLIVTLKAVFQIQYKDSAGNWQTYGTFEGLADPNLATGFNSSLSITPTTLSTANTDCMPKSDPRTFRFGPAENAPVMTTFPSSLFPTTTAGVSLNPSSTQINAPLWGGEEPFIWALAGASASGTKPDRIDMWSVNDSSVTPVGGYYNGTPATSINTSGAASPYYADPDGVQRTGDASKAYPTYSPYFANINQARPIILNRPFQSVGELGYVYRDDPWRTLDLFTSKSADAALLDLFTLSDAPVLAGRVNPNTAPQPVLSALLAGTAQNLGSGTTLSASNANSVAQALTNVTMTQPLMNRANLATSFMPNSSVASAIPSGIKSEREAVIRALAESANTRTWNFLIDIIAQSGRYPKTAATLDNFVVTGERRYWLHIAIDRYTGQIVGKQLEVVNE